MRFFIACGFLWAYIETPETVSFLFASILPGRFWGACYVRKYKLNFRNREMLDKRQHFPTGAESTCLEGRTAGGKSPCGSTFSDHPMDNLTSQLQKKEIRRISKRKLRLAVELLNKETHHRDVMSFFSVLSFQALLCTHAGSKSYVLSTFDWHT